MFLINTFTLFNLKTINKDLIAKECVIINASAGKVWGALVNPDKIKKYLLGTEVITDWKVDSPIVFQGEYDGYQYKDKGNVIEVKPNELLQYNYWSSFSCLTDEAENYSMVTYTVEKLNEQKVKLTWHQKGFANEEGQKHTEKGLMGILAQIKELAETY